MNEKKAATPQGARESEDEESRSPRPDPRPAETPPDVEDLARRVIEAAVEVHRQLGPRHAESVYEDALATELGLRGLASRRQASFSLDYKGHLTAEIRVDLLVERLLVVQLETVERLTAVPLVHAMFCLRVTGLPRGLLINFAAPALMRGVKPLVLNRLTVLRAPPPTAFPRPDPRSGEALPEGNDLEHRVVEAAHEVHRHLGPGYVESVYENALAIELDLRGIPFRRQAASGVGHEGHQAAEGRTDLLVDHLFIVKVRAVDAFVDVHVPQAIAHLKATGLPLALLFDFDLPVLSLGMKRVVAPEQIQGDQVRPPRGLRGEDR